MLSEASLGVPMIRMIALCAAVFSLSVLVTAARPERPQQADARALRLHRSAIVLDTHVDTLSESHPPGWTFDARGVPYSAGHPDGTSVDLPRMREGNLSGAFFSIYIAGTVTGPPAVARARRQFDAIRALVEGHAADLALCSTAAEVRAAAKAGKRAVLIGVEGGHMINNDLAVLGDFARRGARYLTLTHSVNTDWADSSGDKPAHDGLTAFGRQVVRELNRLGVMVDVSHASDKAFWDVLDASESPVIASHSSCRALSGHPRNMTDEMIKALAAKGGTIQINFHSVFLDEALNQKEKAIEPEIKRMQREIAEKYAGPENEQKRAEAGRAIDLKARSVGTTSWEKIIEHIDHAVKLVGADHVGLGSDFDGAFMPAGMEDCTMLPKITAALLAKGYSEGDVRKILGENVLRVMEANEQVARRLQKSLRE
jgi:membrane dipeptidase